MKNKAVLVTGSSSGIGLEIARKCNFSGWDVIHNGRNKDKLNLRKKIAFSKCNQCSGRCYIDKRFAENLRSHQRKIWENRWFGLQCWKW